MSVYYYIGCEACREDAFIVRDGMAGFGAGADLDNLFPFLEKHREHQQHLRFYNEFDPRSEDFADFDRAAFEANLEAGPSPAEKPG